MSKIKVSTLTGPPLDYWAGRSNDDGREYLLSEDGHECLVRTGAITAERYSPSTDWAQGGPIIDREKIEGHFNPYAKTWIARYFDDNRFTGETLLIAAMRCFVAAKFGEEVDE